MTAKKFENHYTNDTNEYLFERNVFVSFKFRNYEKHFE